MLVLIGTSVLIKFGHNFLCNLSSIIKEKRTVIIAHSLFTTATLSIVTQIDVA